LPLWMQPRRWRRWASGRLVTTRFRCGGRRKREVVPGRRPERPQTRNRTGRRRCRTAPSAPDSNQPRQRCRDRRPGRRARPPHSRRMYQRYLSALAGCRMSLQHIEVTNTQWFYSSRRCSNVRAASSRFQRSVSRLLSRAQADDSRASLRHWVMSTPPSVPTIVPTKPMIATTMVGFTPQACQCADQRARGQAAWVTRQRRRWRSKSSDSYQRYFGRIDCSRPQLVRRSRPPWRHNS
jgi:hypothetical protein